MSAAAPEFTPSLDYLRGNAKRATGVLKKKAAAKEKANVALAAAAATWCKTGIGELPGGSAARRALKMEIKKRPDDELDLVADAIRSFGDLAGEDGMKVLDARLN